MSHAEDLQKIIDSSASEISKNFFDWVEATLDKTEWDLFETAIEAGDFRTASDLIIWADYDPTVPITKALQAAGEANSAYISNITGLKNAFDLKDPNALKWIEEHGAELVTEISGEAKNKIKEVIYRGYFSGYTTRQQAEYIKDLVGLDARRQRAVENYMHALLKKDVPLDEISKRSKKYAEKLLKQRAKTIAVNEASEASGRGTYFSTKDAYNRGVLSQEWEGFRIVTWDERLCPKCAPLAGEARQLPDGVYPSTGDTIAKIHVLCRCQEGLRKVGSDRGTTNPNQKEADMTVKKRESMKSSIDVVFEAKGLKETETSIIVPTVPIVEGVFDGHGFPAFRNFDEFAESAKWLDGLTIVTNHEPLDPDARRIGQLREPMAEDGMRRVKAMTEFYKIDLTQRELEALRSKKPLHGSLGYSCYMEYESGDWNGKHYEAKEHGPYVFYEYSLVRNGVVTPEDGAGFNIESESQSPAQRAVKRGKKMSEEIDPGHEPGIQEAVKPLEQRIEALETDLKTVKEEKKTIEDTLVAERKARAILDFTEGLKPGHREKAAEHYEALQADPVKWVRENADKLVTAGEAKQLKGQPVVEAAPEKKFDLAEEQRKLFKY